MTCYARTDRYEPSTMLCAVCRLSWSTDDPEPPLCPRRDIAQRSPAEQLPILTDFESYVSALAPDPFARHCK